ncbi:MFS transporter [Agilicoccus flavus]|uniref:MFS transporter n=1 Tax=Agilicoccus flavus TaxID=2775968 RepID=UPI001CF6BC40|nr:MFS transporter [Agilicoccus flavus]
MSATPPPAPPDLRRAVVAKVSRRLIPFMGLLYFVNYLDRTNIGFAKLTMSEDLGLTATMFGLASGLFFVGYLLLEVPSNLALHRFGARRWIARIMITWGIVASAMAFVPDATWLYILRTLLGVAEAGFFPGMILYLTYWLPQAERTRMTGLFLLAIPISSVVGSPLSGLIMQHADGLFGLAGWRMMFLIEGLPAILLAFVTWFYLTDRPADAAWLEPDERRWLQATLDAEAEATQSRHHWPLRKSLTDPRIWGLSFIYFAAVYGLYALSFFLPTIVAGFSEMFDTKFSLVQTGLIVAVPYAIASVAMVWWGHHSDRTKERVWHVALPLIVAGCATPVALYLQSPFAVMAVVTVTAIGIFCTLPVFWYLPTTFLTGASAAAGIALINSIGNSSGFFAPYITGYLKDSTGGFHAAMYVIGGVMALGGVLALILRAAPPPSAEVDSTEGAAPGRA